MVVTWWIGTFRAVHVTVWLDIWNMIIQFVAGNLGSSMIF